jgi:hypothetical protein
MKHSPIFNETQESPVSQVGFVGILLLIATFSVGGSARGRKMGFAHNARR